MIWAQKITSLKETIRHAKNFSAFPVGGSHAGLRFSQPVEHPCRTFSPPTPAAPQAASAQDSLYKRLGGYDALAAVTDDFLGRLLADPKEIRFFVGLSTDSRTKVRQHVVDFLCVATGGPCKYTGRDMETAHTGLNITEEDWNIAVKALGDTLNKFKVPAREQGEVVSAIASLKSKIVGR